MSELSDIIETLAGTKGNNKISVIEGTVISVSEANRTCIVDPLADNYQGQIEEVYLSAQPNDGLIQIPAIGSVVKVCVCMGIDFPFIIQFSDLDKVIIFTDTSIQFNDGSFGGIVKVQSLVDKINALENKVNSIISTFNTHVHSGVTTGSGSSAVTPTLITGTITPITQVSDINNTRITHG